MPRRLLVPAILLAAIAMHPARSNACDCCCDSTKHHLLIYPKYGGSLYTFERDVPDQAGLTGGGKAAVAGLGLQLKGPFEPKSKWGWAIDAGYGIGDLKSTTTNGSGVANSFETQLKEVSA